jgi:hypothetical protein
MSALNQNYVTSIKGFAGGKGTPQCYQAASAGAFNQLSGSGTLAAYVLFWIAGGIQQIGESFTARQFIWGNLDDNASSGWGIYLEPDGLGQVDLVAGLYGASGLRTSLASLSGGEFSYVERLICAALWYDGTNLSLSVNGSLMPADTNVGADAYVPSARAAVLGGAASADGASAAENVQVVSAGYAPLPFVTASTGALAGLHFRSCRESLSGGYFTQTSGVDWAHRYEAAAAMLAATPGTITKSALGAVQTAAAVAPTTLADQGNRGPTPFVAATPVALNRLGEDDLNLDQMACPDWYPAAAFEFVAIEPP